MPDPVGGAQVWIVGYIIGEIGLALPGDAPQGESDGWIAALLFEERRIVCATDPQVQRILRLVHEPDEGPLRLQAILKRLAAALYHGG